MRLLGFLVGALATLTIGLTDTAAGQPFCGAGVSTYAATVQRRTMRPMIQPPFKR